jgi:phospholipase C
MTIKKLMRAALPGAAAAALSLGFVLAITSVSRADDRDRKPLKHLGDIKHIIVIYQENWSFDSLYGSFPALMVSPIASTQFHSSMSRLSRFTRRDHVAPPLRNDGWGVGVRVPTIIVSPFSQDGGIDDTEYETVSILKLIERRFHLAPLSSRDADPNIHDLTHALGLSKSDRDSD